MTATCTRSHNLSTDSSRSRLVSLVRHEQKFGLEQSSKLSHRHSTHHRFMGENDNWSESQLTACKDSLCPQVQILVMPE